MAAMHPVPGPWWAEAFEASPTAQLVVDADGTLMLVNAAARRLVGIAERDVGRALRQLDAPLAAAGICDLVERSRAERRTVLLGEVEWRQGGAVLSLDLQATPFAADDGGGVRTVLWLLDSTLARALERDLEASRSELQVVLAELSATVGELASANTELEVTSGELASVSGDLQTTSEDLETVTEQLRRERAARDV